MIVTGMRFLFGVTKCSKITLCPWLHNCEYTKTPLNCILYMYELCDM